MSKITVFDVETAPNRCMVGFKDLSTGKVKQFDSSEGKAIRAYIKGRTLVGFNSLNYDNIIVTGMMDGLRAKDLYAISVSLIDGDKQRWDYKDSLKKDNIDLIEVATGQASLKLYGARLGAKKLQDLPYDPHEKHTKKMWKKVCKYNENDLELTELLYNELVPQLNIRKDIGKKYAINVMSRSDAQIAEDVFKKELGITKKPKIDRPSSVTYTAPKYVKFKTKQLKELKKKFESTTYEINKATGHFIPQEWLKEKVVIDGNEYTIGFGGLHSNEKSLSYVGDIKNSDISGMYPNLIVNSRKYPIQLGEKWRDIYKDSVDERTAIKHIYTKLSAVLKIKNNGSYGKLNSVYSILYAPHLMLDTTITGQLSLLMVIEAMSLAGLRVLSANTDGLEYVDITTKGEKIIDKLGKKMNLEWEHASYRALHARDVNSYIAVYDGYTKRKGFYAESTLSKNSQHMIVQDAISEFLLNGTSMEDIIRACTDVSQFCVSRAVTGGALWSSETYPDTDEYVKFIKEFEAGERKDNKALRKRNEAYQKQFILADADDLYVGKTVRFYYSTDGHKLYYKKSGNSVPLSDGCRPMMDLKKKIPKDLDYDKYIELAHKYLKDLGL